jgi:hypothetical protein
VAGWYGFSEKWGWQRIQVAKSELKAEGWTFPDNALPVPPAVASPVPARVQNGSSLSATKEAS